MYKVPARMIEKNLIDLKVGQSAYTVPWALYVADDSTATLNTSVVASAYPVGTISMMVTRLGENEWEVNLDGVPDDYTFPVSRYMTEHRVVRGFPVDEPSMTDISFPTELMNTGTVYALRTCVQMTYKAGYYATEELVRTVADALEVAIKDMK